MDEGNTKKKTIIGFIIAIIILIIIAVIIWAIWEKVHHPKPLMIQPVSTPIKCTTHKDCATSSAKHNKNTLCVNGQCKNNPCATLTSCQNVGGNCGWCFDDYGKNGYQGVGIPGNSSHATGGSCNAYVHSNSHNDCSKAQTCATVNKCTGVPKKSWCGWCPKLKQSLLSDSQGKKPQYSPSKSCGKYVNVWGENTSQCPKNE